MKPFVTSLLCAALLAGCGDVQTDAADEKDPHVINGLEQVQLKQWNRAIRHFETALAKNATLARPDLELALIYQQQIKNYIRAAYHYERYLEKRPESQKRDLINSWIRQAKISLAAEIGQSDGGISQEITRLTRENNLLRKQLERHGSSAPAVANVKTILTQPPKATPIPAPRPKPVITKPEPTPISAKPIPRTRTPAPVPGTYTVIPGDTLSRIARAVYGNSGKWEEIYKANSDKMKDENDLKAGQVIVIPKP